MSRPRAPRIAGVGGGVGTTTLATALRGYDQSREIERGVDVLVCRSTGQSLQQAAVTITRLAANGRPRPVLAVTTDQPGPVRGVTRARLRMIEPQVAALVVLPYVSHWRELTDPLAEAAGLAHRAAELQPRALRRYADALAGLARKLVESGLLGRPAPAAPADRGTPTGPNRTTRPPRSGRPISAAGPVSSTGPVRAVGPVPQVRRPTAADDDSHLGLPLARVAALGGGPR